MLKFIFANVHTSGEETMPRSLLGRQSKDRVRLHDSMGGGGDMPLYLTHGGGGRRSD
jgi:hypothetical protein